MEAKDDIDTVLVVDDEPINLVASSDILREHGYKILVANSGHKALTVIEGKRPDLVLLDIHMPGINGIEVCQQLRESVELRDTPVIFLTSSETAIDEAYSVGGLDYIIKPFRENELIARVNTHIRLSKLQISLEKTNLVLSSLNETLEDKVRERTKELIVSNSNLRKEIGERRRLQDKLEYVAKYDFVTRMLNRSSMEEMIEFKIFGAIYHRERNIIFYIWI